MHREVQRIRKSGYAVDDEEEEPGVRCVAVPVYHANGAFAAGLSVTGTITQIPMPEVESIAGQATQNRGRILRGGTRRGGWVSDLKRVHNA